MSDLKNCPCCNSAARLKEWQPRLSGLMLYRAECTRCSIRSGDHYVKDECVKTWNEREENKYITALEKETKYLSAKYMNAVRAIVELGGNTRALIGEANRRARELYYGK